ncbi:hypothetical protein [Symmachiella dynata]|uniref:hypothetical protein n=1 Tax=Symmachiella dynata TaxID=2527995 RepID=UPI0030EC6F06
MPINDIGKFVGRYFQVLAWLSIASMVISPIFFDSLNFDFTFILLFWVAHHLIRHNATARNWTIGITGFYVALIILMLLYACLAGTESMRVTFGRRIIENPSFGQVATVAIALILLVGVPLGLLLTPKARREFGVVGGPPSAGEGSQACQ